MLNTIGFGEIIILLIVIIIIVGPKKIPETTRQIIRMYNKFQKLTYEIKYQFLSEQKKNKQIYEYDILKISKKIKKNIFKHNIIESNKEIKNLKNK